MEFTTLNERCKIVTQEENDSFVGLNIDYEDIGVFFPLGYNLPDTDKELRKEIIRLFSVLKEFTEKGYPLPNIQKSNNLNNVTFPINAYLELILNYMEHGYYIEKDRIYKKKNRGVIIWKKTIQNEKPLLQKNSCNESYSPIYTSYITKEHTPNTDKEITKIHKYCVYESFEKLGWLFTSHLPLKQTDINIKKSLIILQNKLQNTNQDSKKRLFTSMIEILKFIDSNSNKNKIYWGTENFEYVWEQMIDKAFGIKNKEEYFPRAQWNLQQGNGKTLHPLKPDTIMIYNEKIYIIDAKYYKYGITKDSSNLPGASSINKQITYGEYLDKNKKVDKDSLYNAFLMPYNKENNLFNSENDFKNIGESVGLWRKNSFKYEHIQGILVDVRFLMQIYKDKNMKHIMDLSMTIEEAYDKNIKLFNG